MNSRFSRKLVTPAEYNTYIEEKFHVKKELRNTPVDKEAESNVDRLSEAMCQALEQRGLSPLNDVYVHLSYNRYRIVGMNFVGNNQAIAEEIALQLLQDPQWDGFAFELSPGRDETMLTPGEVEIITKDEILVQAFNPPDAPNEKEPDKNREMNE